MAWNRENDAAVAKYQKETFDKIFNNEIERDNGMKAFYVNPTTYNSSPPKAPGFEAAVQLGDNDAGLELMANGTPETFPLRGHKKSVPETWARGTVDMVDPNGKVAKIDRKMPNNPDRSR